MLRHQSQHVGWSELANPSKQAQSAADSLGVAAERDVAGRQAAADILGDFAVKISVERLEPAAQ
jgi:hypothetical protein